MRGTINCSFFFLLEESFCLVMRDILICSSDKKNLAEPKGSLVWLEIQQGHVLVPFSSPSSFNFPALQGCSLICS